MERSRIFANKEHQNLVFLAFFCSWLCSSQTFHHVIAGKTLSCYVKSTCLLCKRPLHTKTQTPTDYLAMSPYCSDSAEQPAEVFTFQLSFDKQQVLDREGVKPVTKRTNPAAFNNYWPVALTPLFIDNTTVVQKSEEYSSCKTLDVQQPGLDFISSKKAII